MKGPVNTASFEELFRMVGAELGKSGWMTIDQETVNGFGRITGDENPIHVNPSGVDAARFGGTIAHGFLTLSLIAAMAYEVCPAVDGTPKTVNYGFERVRFVSPVRVGSRVRGCFRLIALNAGLGGRWQARYEVTIEIEGGTTPAVVCTWITAGIPDTP